MGEQGASAWKLVVGLGNPGPEYDGTRHNIGFDVVSAFATRHFAGQAKKKFEGQLAEVTVQGQRVLLLCPETYMNLSGRSVQAAAKFYQISPADVLVICDDMNLPLGQLRLRGSGSAGGQKGLANIIACLATPDIPRLRFGVGRPPEGVVATNYVLGRFAKSEYEPVTNAILRAVQGVEDWLQLGTQLAMNRVNSEG